MVLNRSYIQQIENYKYKVKQTDELEANLRTQIENFRTIDMSQQESIEILEKHKGKLEEKLRLTKTTRVIYTSIGIIGGLYLGYNYGK